MLKLDRRITVLLLVLNLMTCGLARAADEGDDTDEFDLENKARQAHKLAASDMMYQNEEWKAMYYQNQLVIQLLKQIRDSLEVIKSHGLKETPEEKSG